MQPPSGQVSRLATARRALRQGAVDTLRALGRLRQRALHPAIFHSPPAANWIDGLGLAITDLEKVNRSTEAGFLAVGEKLGGFLVAARQVSASVASTAERLSGEQGQRDSDALARVLEQTARMQKGTQAVANLSHLRDSANRLRHAFAAFDNTVISFRVLAVLARIETARLGGLGVGLGHLAEEMGACSGDIGVRTEHFLGTAAALYQRVEQELNHISELDARVSKALPPLIDAVARNFATLRGRRELGEAAAAKLGDQFAQFSEAIGSVVTAVQFHDITRQQIEHVIESLRRLHDGVHQGRRDAPTPAEGAVVELQLAQLDNARRTFLESIGQIDRQLETVASRMGEMAAESESLTGSQGGNETFFAAMAVCFADILNAARECEAFDRDARAALAALRQTLESLGEALADIRTIELQLKRLSLNAAIQAVHLGAAGEPFNAVAGAMHNLQADCENRSGQSQAELDSIGAAVHGMLDQETAGQSRDGTGMEAAVDDLRLRMEEMCVANDRGVASRQEIGSLVSQLLAEIQSARQNLSESRGFADAVDGCCERLRSVADWNAGRAEAGAAPAGHLEQCTHHYTMLAEHEVHQELTGGAQPATGDAQAAPASGELELF